MPHDLPVPYNLLTPLQQEMVDSYIDFQLIAINPDSKDKLLEFRKNARDSICTQEGLKRLEAMVQKAEPPFTSPLPSMQVRTAPESHGFSWSSLKRKIGLK